jgi:hypothetical protein
MGQLERLSARLMNEGCSMSLVQGAALDDLAQHL